MQHPIIRALRGAGLTRDDVAARLGVDPKTVARWINGRTPYPQHRTALAELTGWRVADLWPEQGRSVPPESSTHEIRRIYPQRCAVPAESWRHLFAAAHQEIAILAYSGLFLAEDAAVQRVLTAKAAAGVRVRMALGDPAGRHVAQRGAEEGISTAMVARIRNALVLFGRVAEQPGVHLRLHDTVLYNSIYRGDDDLLINTHAYALPASLAPVLVLRRSRGDGMAADHLESFERVWETSRSPTPADAG